MLASASLACWGAPPPNSLFSSPCPLGIFFTVLSHFSRIGSESLAHQLHQLCSKKSLVAPGFFLLHLHPSNRAFTTILRQYSQILLPKFLQKERLWVLVCFCSAGDKTQGVCILGKHFTTGSTFPALDRAISTLCKSPKKIYVHVLTAPL